MTTDYKSDYFGSYIGNYNRSQERKPGYVFWTNTENKMLPLYAKIFQHPLLRHYKYVVEDRAYMSNGVLLPDMSSVFRKIDEQSDYNHKRYATQLYMWLEPKTKHLVTGDIRCEIKLAELQDQPQEKENTMPSPQVQIVKEENVKLTVSNWPVMTVFKIRGEFYVRCQSTNGYNCMSLQTGIFYHSGDTVESLGLLQVK